MLEQSEREAPALTVAEEANAGSGVVDPTPAEDWSNEPIGRNYLIIALLVTASAWIPLFVLRVQAHQANVDDFLYAQTARTIGDNVDLIRGALHTGQTAPLVPTLAAPGAHLFGIYGAMSVQLPLLLLAVVGAFLLTRIWLGPVGSMITALAVGLNVEILGFSVMLHFSVACTAGVLWSFAAYLRSGRLRTWPWAMIFGASVAALLLSRSVALVYVGPLALVILADLMIDVKSNGMRSPLPSLMAVAVVLVSAGPWWLVSGPAALHYLVSAGYQASGGYVSHGGARFNLSAMAQRINGELSDLGWAESWALAAAIALALMMTIRHWAHVRSMRLGLLVSWVVFSILILMTSSNLSTALGLPVLAVLIVVCAVPMAALPTRWLNLVLPAGAVVLLIGMAFQLGTKSNGWWPPPPYRNAIIEAGGTSRTNSDLVTAQVARFMGTRRTLVLKGDPILNANGLTWNAANHGQMIIPPLGSEETGFALAHLQDAELLVTGDSPISFYQGLDQRKVEMAAARDGFVPVRLWRVSATNNVLAWQRLPQGTAVLPLYPRPTTSIRRPTSGGTVTGSIFIAASANDPIGILNVQFEVTGVALASPQFIAAKPFAYGWLGGWTTTGLAPGSYTVQSVVTSVDGETGKSLPIHVEVSG